MNTTVDRGINGEQESLFERFISRIMPTYLRLPSHITREYILTKIIEDPSIVPPAWLPYIVLASSTEYERLRAKERIEDAAIHSKIARNLTEYIDKSIDPHKSVVFPQLPLPQLLMDEATTEGGTLGLVIDPDEDYSQTGQTFLALKRVDIERGRQALRDSQYFRANPNFRLEHILANIPSSDGIHSYLWKEFIIGPNLGNLFANLERAIEITSDDDKRLIKSLEEELTDLSMRRVRHWQIHSPDLIDQHKDPEILVRYYQRNFVELLKGFSQFTDLKYSEEETDNFRHAVHNLNWSFVRSNKIVRKVDATFRNMVIHTGKINIDYSQFIEVFTRNGGKRRVNRYALEQHLYFVDTPNKYAHILEDPWEIDLFPDRKFEQSIVERLEKSAVERSIREYERSGMHFTQEEVSLIGAYRAFRLAHLVLSKFGVNDFTKLKAAKISEEEFRQKLLMYKGYIDYLLKKGNELLQKTSNYVHPELTDIFNIFAPTLQKLSSYTKIDYQKNGHA